MQMEKGGGFYYSRPFLFSLSKTELFKPMMNNCNVDDKYFDNNIVNIIYSIP